KNVIATNDAMTRLLVLWALTIVVLPFPTALVAGPDNAGDQAITKILYVGTMALGSFVLGLVCLVVARHADLRDSADVPDAVRAFGPTATFVLALGLMLLVPGASYWPLLLLLVSDRVISWGRGLRERIAR